MSHQSQFLGVVRTLATIGFLAIAMASCARAPSAESADVSTASAKSDSPPAVVSSEGAAPLRGGEDWPCFLGPNHDGISHETNLLDVWPNDGPPVLWSREIGVGFSAPSVLGDRLVLFHRLGDQEVVECLHAATGKTIWKHRDPTSYRDAYGFNNGPRCTPLLTPTRCYTLGAEGRLSCLNLEDGSVVWQRSLLREFTVPASFFGVVATPILEAGKLIVLVGGQPNSGVVAFDPETGNTLWHSVGRSTWDGAETGWSDAPTYEWTGEEQVVCYASPAAATIHDRRHVLCLMRQGLVSVDPDTGAENFHFWFRARVNESVNASQPVVVGDTILLGNTYRVGGVRLQVQPDGKGVEVLWRHPRNLGTHFATSIYHNGCYFGFIGHYENEGLLQCVDAESGEVKWRSLGYERAEDIRPVGPDKFIDRKTSQPVPYPFFGRGSAILADDKLIVLSERGTLALLEASVDEYRPISRCAVPRIAHPCWTAPVLARGRLYLRSEHGLACLDLAEPPAGDVAN